LTLLQEKLCQFKVGSIQPDELRAHNKIVQRVANEGYSVKEKNW
jgi:hypothetical protein